MTGRTRATVVHYKAPAFQKKYAASDNAGDGYVEGVLLNATRIRKKPDTIRLFHGSPSWTRTNDPAVNSRMLWHTSV
ncbi:MAG: hypothetical protein LBR74_00070 [Eubacterium sp.]|nr:hypothetical protein [Eubacterium sp.]